MTAQTEAWHEAGHALAAHLLGGVVREVTVESEMEGFEGHVAVEWRRGRLSEREEASRLATVALAGPVAELVFRGDDLLDDIPALASWRSDWEEAQEQLGRLHGDAAGRERALHKILAQLREFFGEGRGYDRLARVADALDAHLTLDEGLFLDAAGEA